MFAFILFYSRYFMVVCGSISVSLFPRITVIVAFCIQELHFQSGMQSGISWNAGLNRRRLIGSVQPEQKPMSPPIDEPTIISGKTFCTLSAVVGHVFFSEQTISGAWTRYLLERQSILSPPCLLYSPWKQIILFIGEKNLYLQLNKTPISHVFKYFCTSLTAGQLAFSSHSVLFQFLEALQDGYDIIFKMKFGEKLKAVEGKLFINGKLVDSKGGKMFDVINPATEKVFGKGVGASPDDVNDAVLAAKEAFDNGEWRKMSAFERGKIMYKFADLIEANAQWLGYFETLNNGKPLKASITQDVPYSAFIYRYFAGQCDKIKGSTLTTCKGVFAMTLKEPIGVVGQIIPWNYPLLMMTWKVAPALAAGCTIVIKPAEQTPFTALMLGDLINQAGFPPGVINIVTGFGQTGASIAQHKLVNKVSFTGSTEVGYIVMRTSHKDNLKPVTLELGGKSANIIMPDADMDQAVEQACVIFSNAGQSCVAGTRTFVHESLYDQFIKRAKKMAESIKVGDPMEEDTQQGAQISKEQFDKILGYIDSGKKEGARLVAGGNRHGKAGYFIEPTIFADVKDEMKIAREEIFGPVMSILKWSKQEQVIKRANSLPYGLGAGIVTKDVKKCLQMCSKLQAGTVYVNMYDYQEGSTPFGGVKDSGIGKDLGDEGLESYMNTKTIIMKANL